VLLPRQQAKLARGAKDKEHAMPQKLNAAVAVVGIDIGKNSFHFVGLDKRGSIALRQKWSRGQVEARLANMPPCLIGMEACVPGSDSCHGKSPLETARSWARYRDAAIAICVSCSFRRRGLC
jgi:hypothetical protein